MIHIRSGLSVRKLSVSRISVELKCEISGILVIAIEIRLVIIKVYRPCSGDIKVFLGSVSLALNYCINSTDVFFG